MILDVSEICSKMDPDLATFVHNIITLIKIAVPVVLVVFGMLDLGKGVVASKEDEIKKGQQTFIKRLLAGVIVFFIISITQLVISVIDKESNGAFWECANKIMNGEITGTTKNGKEQIIKEKNPSSYRYCCELNNGTVQGNSCKTSDGKIVDSNTIVKCTQQLDGDLTTKYSNETKTCCESLGGNYSNGSCKDKNGGTIAQNNISECVINGLKNSSQDYYDTCCREKGGNPSNGKCIDNNGGNILEEAINSCVLEKKNNGGN